MNLVVNDSENPSPLAIWLDRAIIFWLFVFAVFAPHSIAVTQSAWLLGMLFWVIRVFVHPRPKTYRTPVDYVLLGFFILTGISAVLSYEPLVSIGKLRAAALFTIVYLFAENVPSRRVVRMLALALIGSCLINVFYTAGTRVLGRGVKLNVVQKDSPLTAGVIRTRTRTEQFPIVSGDTVLKINGHAVANANDLEKELEALPGARVAVLIIYRDAEYPPVEVPLGRLLAGSTAVQRLGISSWSKGRDWRASGFYDHYTTYAEVLQLITSLALGLFVCLPLKRSLSGALLLLALAGLGFALVLTVTRASWLAFMISAGLIILVGTSRRTILIAAACVIPLVLGGLLLLQQKRHVGFFDKTDASTTWRETVWHEGFDLLIQKPRHLLVGVGMDSLKSHWREWGLFDKGLLPIGHMHSNLLELALERGLPTLLAWLILIGVYARTLVQTLRALTREKGRADEGKVGAASDLVSLGPWLDRGIVLGALGGLAGFFSSGLVHYNWGDSEIVMVFYFIMGLSLVLARHVKLDSAPARSPLPRGVDLSTFDRLVATKVRASQTEGNT
jgi:O-antigen ligase